MNYSEPNGEQIDIALSRVQASGADRRGSLLFNFGGFGGGGIGALQDRVLDDFMPDSILDSYDLVGFDPRGVESSTIVDCTEQGAGEENIYPANADQLRELIANYEQVAADCIAEYGDYLQHLGSINVVRDMENIRIALGEDTINFYGASAGTRIAALYLQEYPESSGRFILDASISPDHNHKDDSAEALPGRQATLIDGLSLCTEDDPNCDAQLLSTQLSERATTLALENTEASKLEYLLVDLVIGATLETPEAWPVVVEPVIDYINSSDVTGITDLIGQFEDFDDPAELFDEEDPGIIAERAIVCADDASRPTVDSLLLTLEEFNQASDYFAESSIAVVAFCAGWPEALEPLAPIVTNTAPTSLVIGGTQDPLTPLIWSQEMATQIGGVYIGSAHDGHTGLFDEKSPCLELVAAEFLLDGTIPATDAVIPVSEEECTVN